MNGASRTWIASVWNMLVATALLVGAAAAQERTTLGTFVDDAGAPIAGAQVTLATSDPLVFDAYAPAEVVTATTDAKGRVRVSLRTGRSYSAWACEGHDAARPARSGIVEGVVAGELFELRVAERSQRRRLQVDEFDQLGEGPFRLRLRCDARHGPEWDLPIDEEGGVELPPLPAGPLLARIVDGEGQEVCAGSIESGKVYVFPLQTYRVRVVDEQGKPVADAPVYSWAISFAGHTRQPFMGLRLLPRRVPHGRTGPDGMLEVRCRSLPEFLYTHDGERSAVCGGIANGGPMVDGVFDEPDWQASEEQRAAYVHTLTLRGQDVLRGRLHRGDQPVAARGLLVRGGIRVEGKGGMAGTVLERSFEVSGRSGSDGGFAIDSVPRPIGSFRLHVETAAGEAPVLLRYRKKVAAQPLDLDLAKWPVVTFQVLDETRGPPGEARVALWTDPKADPVVLVADRAGRVRAQLEPGSWVALATGKDAARFDVLEVGLGERTRTLELPLEPLATCSGTLKSAEGVPIAGRPFFLSTYNRARLPEGTPPRQRLLHDYAMPINRGLTSWTRTAADGSFVLRFVPVESVVLGGGFSSTGLTLTPGKVFDLRGR